MLIIPVTSTPSQVLNITLANQACKINVYQRFYGLFCDLFINSTTPIVQGVLCLNQNYIVRSLYLGFAGDLTFFDTQGTNDPDFTGLGSRFLFLYLQTFDLPASYGQSK